MFEDGNITPSGALRRAMHAMIVGGLGAIVVVCLITYSPFDTTGDTAGLSNEMSNFLGLPGASLANFVLQMFGWAALPIGLLMMFAAARAVLRPRIGITRWDTARRTSLFISTAFFLTVFLAAFPIPQSWPMATGLGGWLGDSVFQSFKGLFTSMQINARVAGGFTAFVIFCLLGYSFGRFLGVVGRDVADVLDAAGLVWAIFRVWLDRFTAFIKRRFHKSYVEPEEVAGFDDRKVWMEGPSATPTREPTPVPAYEPAPEPVPNSTEARKPRRTAKPKGHNFKFPKNGKFVLPTADLMRTPPARVAVTDAATLQKSAEELVNDGMRDFTKKKS